MNCSLYVQMQPLLVAQVGTMLAFDITETDGLVASPKSQEWLSTVDPSEHVGHVYCLVSPADLATWDQTATGMSNLLPLVMRAPVNHCVRCSAVHSTFTRAERFLNSFQHTLCRYGFTEGCYTSRSYGNLLLPLGSHYDLFHRYVRPFLALDVRVWTVVCTGSVWHSNRYYKPKLFRFRCCQYGLRHKLACYTRLIISRFGFTRFPAPPGGAPLRQYQYLLEETSEHDQDCIIELILVFLLGFDLETIRPLGTPDMLLKHFRIVRRHQSSPEQ